MLSDQEIEEAATVVAQALGNMTLRTNLARGYIAVIALEEAGYTLERLDPGPPELADHLEDLLKASLHDRGRTADVVNRFLDATQGAEILDFPR